MPRRCTCARLIAAVEGDPRLRTLPLAARMLFLLVAEAAARAPEFGVLPFSGSARVSLLVSASETEVETHLETLVAEGLVRAEGARLVVPLLAEAPPRTEAARRNGAAGGRPRRGETPAAARERRQSEMMLALPGGGAPAAPETQGKPNAENPPLLLITTPSAQEEGSSAREDWVSIGQEVAEIAGLDPARGGYDFRPVQAWLNAGKSRAAILAAVRGVVEWKGYQPRRVFSLTYFTRAVEKQAEPARPASAEDAAADAAAIARAEAMIEAARRGVAA